jgi:hypothetical protein
MNPSIVSLEMGYGHLRAAHALADALGERVQLADAPPLADRRDRWLWKAIRTAHKVLSHPGPIGGLEKPANALMDLITEIPPLLDSPALDRPDLGAQALDRLIEWGLGDGLVGVLRQENRGIVTTFYAPAIIADRAGIEPVYAVVTDADVQRIWVAHDPERSRIHYCAPSPRVVRRLRAYGVRQEQITLTGFPLPHELTGVESRERLRADVARRIVRLDREGAFTTLHQPMLEQVLGPLPLSRREEPIELVFAVGGAGAQVQLSETILSELRDHVIQERLRIHLVAGTRHEVAERFLQQLERVRLARCLGKQVTVLFESDFAAYYRAFNELLSRADVLWTKPSELSFYAGLGIPLVLSHPVGTHERYNRRWLREQGAGLKQRRPEHLPGWLDEWCSDGTLAQAAWSAYTRIPAEGTQRIVNLVRQKSAGERPFSPMGGPRGNS